MGKLNGQRYHFLYRTTNLITKKFYIGVHSTYNLEDGYLGSGKRLKRAVKKYGVENFKIEILEFFENREKVLQREKEFVNEQLLNDPLCINLQLGGGGGFSVESAKKGAKNFKKRLKNDPIFFKKISRIRSEIAKKYHKLRKELNKPFNWTGLKHKEETKRKIGKANSINQKGEKNSQYLTCWISNIEKKENKKIKIKDLQFWLNQNWIKERRNF